MNELKLKGGARVGWLKSSYADLTITQDKLKLDTFISNLIFQPSDIISIEPYNTMVLIGQAIKINHRVESYKKTIIFYTNSKHSIIGRIEKIGFLDNKKYLSNIDEAITEKQIKGGFPIKKSFAIGAIIVWHLLFLSDFIPFFLEKKMDFQLGMEFYLRSDFYF